MSTTIDPGPAVEATMASNFEPAVAREKRPIFRPEPPKTFDDAGLSPAMIDGLILKQLLSVGFSSGRSIASVIGLPYALFTDVLTSLQRQKLLMYTEVAPMGDFNYTLTAAGRARAREYMEQSTYVGAAPVCFDEYEAAVAAQTIATERPRKEELRRAFSDLLIDEEMIQQLGPAINSGRGIFLYGMPGNGKTSIAERITRCFSSTVWIPRLLEMGGLLVKLYDPSVHEPATRTHAGTFHPGGTDERWIEIQRPTVVVGGELTMEHLEIRYDPVSRLSEASLQMKSNNGTLLIDDFGRQRMRPVDLLNRMIMPLERRFDFQTLSNGKSVRVPFDQLTLFSTNLEPKQLVDEAFLRRIPYKIHVADPDESMFRRLIALLAPKLGFAEIDAESIDHLISRHYRQTVRPFRSCHPRDLLLQARNYCVYNGEPMRITPEVFDFAVACYFTTMS